jgi:HEAT repeat protein
LKRRADWVIRGEAASVLWRLERSRRAADALCDAAAATGDPQVLLTLHRGAPDSIRFLVERLQAKRPSERFASIYVLAYLGPDAKSAEPRLIAALEEDDVGMRCFAADALGRITAESDDAASALDHLFEAGSQEERFAAAKSLARMQRHRPAVVVSLARTLKDSVAGARRTACYGLGQLGPVAVGAATDLNAALADDDESVRNAAITALARLGPGAIPTLVEALGDRNPVRREGALEALRHVTGDRSIAVPRVVELLDDGDPQVAKTAPFVLAELNAVDGASDALIRLIRNSKDPGVRQAAVWALRKANRDADRVVSALIAAISDSDSGVASLAIDGLNELGPRASAAESAILPICRDDSSFLYASAVTALGSLRSPSVMVSLTEFLQHHKNPSGRLNAALGLAKFGAPARPVLIGALADKDPLVQIAVIRAIYDIDGRCDHVEQLVDVLQHPDFDPVNGSLTSIMAAMALEHIGADARAAAPVLRQMIDLYDLSLSLAAIKALWKITGSKDEVLPAYFNLLAIGDAQVRGGVADALGIMGPAAASAKSRLVLLLEDDEVFVRTAAMRALAKLESVMP